MAIPFGFGALKLAVTPGGGGDGFPVASRKAARLDHVPNSLLEEILVVVKVDIVGIEVDIVEMEVVDIVGMTDDEIK